MKDDTISRQAAIDAYGDWYVEEGTEEGFIGTVKQLLEGLPSAQLEIVRCKNCKHNQLPSTSPNASCEIFYGMTDQNGFCHKAERRTDEQT